MPRERVRASRVMIAAGVVAVALAVALGPRLVDPPTHANPDSSASTSVAEGPSHEWRLPAQEFAELPPAQVSSPLYEAQASALHEISVISLTGCPEPNATTSREQWEQAVTAQWDCLGSSWADVFEQHGVSTDFPEVQFFTGAGESSPCGWIEAPAFYCSADGGSVYFGTAHFEMAKDWDLSVNEMVNHEFVHHLQALFGITTAKVAAGQEAHLDRRAELQATCLSATLTLHNDAVRFDAAAYDGWVSRLETMLADEAHGTTGSLREWGLRGLYASSYGDCNTWVADDEAVA